MNLRNLVFLAVLLTACSKEDIIYQPCIEYDNVSDVSFNSNYIVIYYKYDLLSVNEAYKYGIGDSLMITSHSSISDVISTKSNLSQALNRITCDDYDYIHNYHLTFDNYVPNSCRFEIYESNSGGHMKNSNAVIIKLKQ